MSPREENGKKKFGAKSSTTRAAYGKGRKGSHFGKEKNEGDERGAKRPKFSKFGDKNEDFSDKPERTSKYGSQKQRDEERGPREKNAFPRDKRPSRKREEEERTTRGEPRIIEKGGRGFKGKFGKKFFGKEKPSIDAIELERRLADMELRIKKLEYTIKHKGEPT